MLASLIRELRVLESLRWEPPWYEDFSNARWALKKAIRAEFAEECIPPEWLVRMRLDECRA